MGMFGSMVTIIFQSTFHAEMHKNDFFLFFKNYFEISISKQSKT
jgi:hypothetical protein